MINIKRMNGSYLAIATGYAGVRKAWQMRDKKVRTTKYDAHTSRYVNKDRQMLAIQKIGVILSAMTIAPYMFPIIFVYDLMSIEIMMRGDKLDDYDCFFDHSQNPSRMFIDSVVF